jgi:hypothetical protein
MNDILDDLNTWLDLLVVDRRYRQQAGEEPGADMDLVSRAIDEIEGLRRQLAAAKEQASVVTMAKVRINSPNAGQFLPGIEGNLIN